MKKSNYVLIILMFVLTIGVSMPVMIQCDTTDPGLPIVPGVFGPHPEIDEHMYLQANYVYLEEETEEEVWQIAIILGETYNAFDTYYENNERGALVAKSVLDEKWAGDDWACAIILPHPYTATMSYYSSEYEGGVDTASGQMSFNLTSWDPDDTKVSMDELDPPLTSQVALNFDSFTCENYETGEVITDFLTDTNDEAVLYKNTRALELEMAELQLITRD